MANPPRNSRNTEKLLKADGVGNGFGLVKEYLKDKFGRHDDWKDETWFTLSKGALVKKLERDSVRGTSGVDEVPGKIGIVRVNPDADIVEGHAGISTTPYADDIPDLVARLPALSAMQYLRLRVPRRHWHGASPADSRYHLCDRLLFQVALVGILLRAKAKRKIRAG